MFYRFFIAVLLIANSFYLIAEEKGKRPVKDEFSFKIFLFDGYLVIPNHYFVHGLVAGNLVLSSFKTGSSVKIYYEKPEHVLKAINLMNLRNEVVLTEYGFNHMYGESDDFGNVVYLYSNEEAFFASGIDRAFYDLLLSDFKKKRKLSRVKKGSESEQ